MSLVTRFDITLFVDDMYLSHADKNLFSFEHRVNEELNRLNGWFCKHKLSINNTKTNYVLINKISQKPVNHVFNLSLIESLSPVSEVKYLGIYINDALNWPTHTKYLS